MLHARVEPDLKQEADSEQIRGTLWREAVCVTPLFMEPEEDGGLHVWYPALKGCHSQGETQEGALEHIQEAIAVYLESVQV